MTLMMTQRGGGEVREFDCDGLTVRHDGGIEVLDHDGSWREVANLHQFRIVMVQPAAIVYHDPEQLQLLAAA